MSIAPLVPLAPLPPPALSGGVSAAAKKVVAGIVGGAPALLFGVSAARLIAIAVGLILIAAAVFSFRPVREVAVGVAKEGAKAAAAA